MDADPRSPLPPRAPLAFAVWLWQLVKDVAAEYSADRVGDVAAAITFWTVLSIPAAVLALVSTLSSLDAVVGESITADMQSEIEGFITSTFSESDALNSTVRDLFSTSSNKNVRKECVGSRHNYNVARYFERVEAVMHGKKYQCDDT